MKRTTLYLDEKIDLELARLAKQKGRSKADLMRAALDSYVKQQGRSQKGLPDWVGAGRSGEPDLSERTDELLAELYEQDYEKTLESWETYKREHSS